MCKKKKIKFYVDKMGKKLGVKLAILDIPVLMFQATLSINMIMSQKVKRTKRVLQRPLKFHLFSIVR